MAPQLNYDAVTPLFLLSFIFIGSVIFNLVVGVLVKEYINQHEELAGTKYLDNRQLFFLDGYKQFLETNLRRPFRPPVTNGLGINSLCLLQARLKLYSYVTHKHFNHMITIFICINLIILMFPIQDVGLLYYLENGNRICEMLYLLEMLLKMAGVGILPYFRDSWCRLEAFLVLTSVLDVYFDYFSNFEHVTAILLVMHIFRPLRLLRLVERSAILMMFVRTLQFSLPALTSIGLVLLLVFFVYAIIGISLFGKVIRGDFLTENANFESFPIAMLTVFRMSTGETWNGLMHDCLKQPPYCSFELENCGNVWQAYLFFFSFFFCHFRDNSQYFCCDRAQEF